MSSLLNNTGVKSNSVNLLKSKSAEIPILNKSEDLQSIQKILSEAASKESINQDFIEISAKIQKHNRCIDDLKRQIQKKTKTKKTCIDERELNCLECCLQKELLSLYKLKRTAIEMQATNQNKPWGFIPISTTLEEDRMPRVMAFASAGSFNSKMSMQSKDNSPTACIQDNLIAQNIDLETNRDQLKRDLINRNNTIESLTKKLQCLQFQMQKMAKSAKTAPKCPCESKTINSQKDNDLLDQMSAALKQIQQELNAIQMTGLTSRHRSEDENCYDYSMLSPMPPAPDVSLSSENDINPRSYEKDRELCYLREKIADLCSYQSTGHPNSPEKIELDLCHRRIKDFQEEQDDFKNLIVEQQKQLNDYRDKYLQAQQKVIEQKCEIDNMELNNKRIEEQINNEMYRIKKRFQDKLDEMAPLPKILENEKFRLAEMTKRNEELETKISIVCTELRQTKKELSKLNGNGKNALSLESKCAGLCAELCELKKKMEQMLCERHCLETQLKHIQDELNTSQKQSNRLLARTKERCEMTKDNMKARIDQLEVDLAQCRADAAICLADREAVIRQMKSQLTDLSGSFDSAQKQIRNLKNRMNILSEPRSEPNKELNNSGINCNC